MTTQIKSRNFAFVGIALATLLPVSLVSADQVILDDLIVDGSVCAGFDCVNGESFGFDTLRLKENNLRIKFQDTSNSASFPSNDWQLTANDTSNGGANKFSIDDIDGGRTPFTIEAGAPTHSLFVDDDGRIGLGTSTPVVEVHVKDGDSPTLRLEQDGSSGFTPQTWDIAGNETNFFIRDATNGSRLPFRIRPSAPSNSIFVDTDGDVGMNTSVPEAGLHVVFADSEIGMKVQNNGATTSNSHVVLDAVAAGRPNIRLNNSISGVKWLISAGDDGLYLSKGGTGVNEFVLDSSGNLTLTGTVTAPSSRKLKHEITALDASSVLERIRSLEIAEWKYIKDQTQARHLGPMAEDFHAAFGLGASNDGISPSDLAGVALAAIQAQQAEIDALKREVASRDARISKLESGMAETDRLIRVRLNELENRVIGMGLTASAN